MPTSYAKHLMDFFGKDLWGVTYSVALRLGFYRNAHLTPEDFLKIKKELFPEEFI